MYIKKFMYYYNLIIYNLIIYNQNLYILIINIYFILKLY
jgi:hypothetical protein